jgi:hypothetical protein
MTEARGLDPEPPGGLFAVHEAGDGNATDGKPNCLSWPRPGIPRRGLNLSPSANLTRRVFLWAASDTSLQA